MIFLTVSLIVLGYLLGSIPFGLLLARLAGAGDIRLIGSGNIGATNVLRTGRKGLAALTLFMDGAKGAVAVALAPLIVAARYGHSFPEDGADLETLQGWVALTGVAALLGHVFPVWLHLKGGKGVATSIGVILVCAPLAGVLTILTWLAVAVIFRISSLAALVAAVMTPLYVLLWGQSEYAVMALVMVALVIAKHKTNIQRLLAGTEPKIGMK